MGFAKGRKNEGSAKNPPKGVRFARFRNYSQRLRAGLSCATLPAFVPGWSVRMEGLAAGREGARDLGNVKTRTPPTPKGRHPREFQSCLKQTPVPAEGLATRRKQFRVALDELVKRWRKLN